MPAVTSAFEDWASGPGQTIIEKLKPYEPDEGWISAKSWAEFSAPINQDVTLAADQKLELLDGAGQIFEQVQATGRVEAADPAPGDAAAEAPVPNDPDAPAKAQSGGFWALVSSLGFGIFGFAAVTLLIVAGVIFESVGAWWDGEVPIGYQSLLTQLSDQGVARGLITFVFTFGVMSLALLIVMVQLISDDSASLRFDRVKEILTALIAILATIMGFYFGSENAKVIETFLKTEYDQQLAEAEARGRAQAEADARGETDTTGTDPTAPPEPAETEPSP